MSDTVFVAVEIGFVHLIVADIEDFEIETLIK